MPAPTDSDGSTIRWRIENAHGRPPGVYFISSLPSETSATGAIAQAEIEAPTYPTHDDVVVELLDSAGRVSDAASVGISVTAPALPPRDVHTRVTMHVTDRGVGGRVIAEAACVANRVVTLHRRPDANSTVDSALTNRRGRWRLRVTRPGTYLARVEATSVYRGRQTYNCLSDRTFDVEITRQSRRH
jgi:hypothetical protein